MKRWISIAMVLAMLCCGACAAAAEMPLIAGVTTKMTGAFFTAKWGVNAADVDLRELIHGHNTISWEMNGDYAIDETVVKKLELFEESGNKRYRISLNSELRYNDGSPITAWDYAFSALLLSSAEFEALGGAATEMSWLLGYDALREGKPFSGVRVIDDHTLDLTIDKSFLPYFYEIVLLNITPYPIAVLAPGCSVKDDGQGAYVDGSFQSVEDKLAAMRQDGSLKYIDEAFLTELLRRIDASGADAYPNELFCEELLRETILKGETGYLYQPTVAAGPYMLESFDSELQVAQLARNPYYAGNFEGVIPQIDQLTVVYQDSETALDAIESGEIDLVNKVSDGKVIADGLARLRDEGSVRQVQYLRTGLNFISFACELGAAQSVNVRRAVALCVDRNEVITQFAQGYSMPVYGYYGLGQWMAQGKLAELEQYQTTVDMDAAIALLEADGWVLDAAGEAYDAESQSVRYRKGADGTLEKLALKWAQPEETALSELLEEAMRLNLQAIGVEVEILQLPFDELLMHYYRQADREFHMFSLATNFNLAFDPYYAFHTGEEFQGESNKTGLRDEELMGLALAMRQTQAQDEEAYVEKWLEFQDRFCRLQPMIPLFSNVYFDFFRTDLQQYNANAYFSWATAIVYAYIGEPPAEEDGLGMALEDDAISTDDDFVIAD